MIRHNCLRDINNGWKMQVQRPLQCIKPPESFIVANTADPLFHQIKNDPISCLYKWCLLKGKFILKNKSDLITKICNSWTLTKVSVYIEWHSTLFLFWFDFDFQFPARKKPFYTHFNSTGHEIQISLFHCYSCWTLYLGQDPHSWRLCNIQGLHQMFERMLSVYYRFFIIQQLFCSLYWQSS